MHTETDRPSGIRASDAERDEIARTIQQATADGRLTVEEADDRLAQVFATKYRDELPALVADLPRTEPDQPGIAGNSSTSSNVGQANRWPTGRVPFPLAVHAVIVLLWSALLVTRWVASDAGYFWPAFPIFWLTVSLLVHAAIRARRRQGRGQHTPRA